MNQKAHMACNFNCFLTNKGFLKVTRSHLHPKYSSVSETMQDGVIDTTDN